MPNTDVLNRWKQLGPLDLKAIASQHNLDIDPDFDIQVEPTDI